MWRVEATNAKGARVVEFFTDSKIADVRHKELWNEIDKNGMLLWGTVRTTKWNEGEW